LATTPSKLNFLEVERARFRVSVFENRCDMKHYGCGDNDGTKV
jgi:hypothetical protein